MAEKTLVMLAKNMEESKLEFPLYLSEKIDGIAYTFFKLAGKVFHTSRQNKPLKSVEHLARILTETLRDGDKIYGELYVPGMDFKDSGGIIRRDAVNTNIVFGMYDFMPDKFTAVDFHGRFQAAHRVDGMLDPVHIHAIPQRIVYNREELDEAKEAVRAASKQPTFEGWMFRSFTHQFKAGKRSWGMQRETMQGSLDLSVVSVDQAFSAGGEPLGRVGRINCYYPHKVGNKTKDTIGVGPGKLTHDKATTLWNNREKWLAMRPIVEVKYKQDPSYSALRQPTYQQWRRDKLVPDVEPEESKLSSALKYLLARGE